MTPHATYLERLALRTAAVDALRVRERRISYGRLAAFAATVGLLFWLPLTAAAPFALFVVLLVMHEHTLRARKRAESGARFFERGTGRLTGAWQGRGDTGSEFAEEHHPYAGDFDLFGQGSLFELISIALTQAGRRRLAGWLKGPPASIDEIRARQEAVAELRDNLDLREDLAADAGDVAKEIESADLAGWSRQATLPLVRWERVTAIVLPVATLVAVVLTLPSFISRLVGWTHPEASLRLGWMADVPATPLIVLVIATIFFVRRLEPRIERVVSSVERAEPALALLAGVVGRIEREPFETARLRELRGRLTGADGTASVEIDRLRRLVALLDARRNQFFAPFAVLLLWTVHVALAIERWRLRSGSHIAEWMESAGEIEALASLASFAFEHPRFVNPEVIAEGPEFDAVALGHPLIPEDRRVTNDIRLGGDLRLLVVSGSNMSGKSTMMRSVGIAAVLAMAGAPVCAASLRLSVTRIGASIRVHDSLQENASRFYAEILRIRQVIELSRQGPLLFLLDEILAGTNSHDRRIGAEAIVRGLVERGATGLVSTHDLALARIADELAPRAANVHFEDRIEDGRVVFDYRMRPGVVTRSNALALMRSVGIEV